MNSKRKVEIFSAGCPLCQDVLNLVRELSCPSCEIQVLDMKDKAVASRARELGIRSVPGIAVDSTVADCCAGRGPDEATLRAAGIGKPIP